MPEGISLIMLVKGTDKDKVVKLQVFGDKLYKICWSQFNQIWYTCYSNNGNFMYAKINATTDIKMQNDINLSFFNKYPLSFNCAFKFYSITAA